MEYHKVNIVDTEARMVTQPSTSHQLVCVQVFCARVYCFIWYFFLPVITADISLLVTVNSCNVTQTI